MEEYVISPRGSMFGLRSDRKYIATKTKDGSWSVVNEDGNKIVIADSFVTVQDQKEPAGNKVGIRMSEAEKVALAVAKGEVYDSASSKSQPNPASGTFFNSDSISKSEDQEDEPREKGEKKGKQKEETSIASSILGNIGGDDDDDDTTSHYDDGANEDDDREDYPDKEFDLFKYVSGRKLLAVRRKLQPREPILDEYQCWLTDLTNGQLPMSGVDHKIAAYPDSHWPEETLKDVPEFNKDYEWDADTLEAVHLMISNNMKGLLTGYPGTGKTTAFIQYAALINQPHLSLNGKRNMDGSNWIGYLIATEGSMHFSEGLLPMAMREGYLVTINEIFKIPSEVQMAFQSVYEENGTLLLDEKPGKLADKTVSPSPEFRLGATDNVKGVGDKFELYGGTQVQDISSLDRFLLTQEVPYLSKEKELSLLRRIYPGIPIDTLKRFVSIAGLVRAGLAEGAVQITLSVRGLEAMCRLYQKGLSEWSAYRLVYWSKMGDNDTADVAKEYSDTVGLSNDIPVLAPSQTHSASDSGDEGFEDDLIPPWQEPISSDYT